MRRVLGHDGSFHVAAASPPRFTLRPRKQKEPSDLRGLFCVCMRETEAYARPGINAFSSTTTRRRATCWARCRRKLRCGRLRALRPFFGRAFRVGRSIAPTGRPWEGGNPDRGKPLGARALLRPYRERAGRAGSAGAPSRKRPARQRGPPPAAPSAAFRGPIGALGRLISRFGRFCCASLRFIVIKYTDTRRSPQDATYRARAESSKEGPATRGV